MDPILLGPRGSPPHHQLGEGFPSLVCPYLVLVTSIVEEDTAPDPTDVGPLSVDGLVFGEYDVTNAIR
jgi:hypothetical protein